MGKVKQDMRYRRWLIIHLKIIGVKFNRDPYQTPTVELELQCLNNGIEVTKVKELMLPVCGIRKKNKKRNQM